jgi:cyclophilin family peptidyl-prolyl cis-trans isomerase
MFTVLLLGGIIATAQPTVNIKKSDLKKDVLMVTDSGNLILRLKDETPMHRDNFIKLVKSKYYNDISFHRVIAGFMIQAGDEKTKQKADSNRFLTNWPQSKQSLQHRNTLKGSEDRHKELHQRYWQQQR